MPFLHGSRKIVAGLAQDGLHVLLGEVQLELLLLHLAQVEELVGELQESGSICLDGEHVLLGALLVAFAGNDLVKGHLDQGEGSADLMREVGEVLDLGVVYLFLLVVLHLCHLALPFHFPLAAERSDGEVKEPKRHEEIKNLGQKSLEQRGLHGNLKGLVCFGAVVSDYADIEYVAARLDARERCAVAGGCAPEGLAFVFQGVFEL